MNYSKYLTILALVIINAILAFVAFVIIVLLIGSSIQPEKYVGEAVPLWKFCIVLLVFFFFVFNAYHLNKVIKQMESEREENLKNKIKAESNG